MASDWKVYWNDIPPASGAIQLHPRIAGTYGNRWLVDEDWGSAALEHFRHPAGFGGGQVYMGWGLPEERKGRFTILYKASTERTAQAALEEMKLALRVSRGPVKLVREYYESTGPTQRRQYLEVVLSEDPAMSWIRGRPSLVGLYSAGQLELPVMWETSRFPLFRAYTEETDTVSISTTLQNKNITNSGEYPIGLKFTLSGLGGNWTQITVINTTAGPNGESGGTVTWTRTNFANSDYFDWRHTDPSVVDLDSDTALSNPGTASLWLWPGVNALTVQGVGGTSGTGTIAWREHFG